MARGFLPFLFLLTCSGALSLGATAQAQAPDAPAAAPPPYAPPPPVYAPAPYPPPIYAPPPYQVMAPYDNQLYAGRAQRYRPPYQTFAWRVLLEFGGSPAEGRVLTSVDGRLLRTREAVRDARELRGVFDLRLGIQRLFGDWFGLGLQLGYANWQSGYLDALDHRRSHYLSLAVVPEVRFKLGSSCRRCFSLIAGLRLGALLSVTGAYHNQGWNYAQAEVGGGGLWGAQGGIEARVSERLSLRLLGQYEGAFLQNRVDYGRLGSELLSFRIDRGAVSFAFAVGLR